QFSTRLVKENALIVVGNVSSSKLAKTKMAKSVLDAGWYTLKTQLDYKSKAMQAVFLEVNESYTTQTCSYCGCISSNSPKGRAGLGIREWTCPECGAMHDRDVNAAKNILAAGHCRLAGGIPAL
ncbi:Putative transposase DNA-binding domain-containing protein, partial [Thiothrix eikelboomii]